MFINEMRWFENGVWDATSIYPQTLKGAMTDCARLLGRGIPGPIVLVIDKQFHLYVDKPGHGEIVQF